ncbi:MAG: hypothetical protein J6T45_02955 [Fibrobacterales bacterium]|nr:hypothetical protein [Fibrobacterales bacterium]
MNNLADSLTDAVISGFVSWLPLLIGAAVFSIAVSFVHGRIDHRNSRRRRNRG